MTDSEIEDIKTELARLGLSAEEIERITHDR